MLCELILWNLLDKCQLNLFLNLHSLPVINDENSHNKKLIIKNRNIVKQKIELVLGEEGGQQSIDNARAILHSKLQKLRNKIDSKHCPLCDNWAKMTYDCAPLSNKAGR